MSVTISQTNSYNSLVQELTSKSVREKLVLFVQRRGYGAMTRVAEASGITVNYLIRFRKGETDVEKKTLIAINAGIDALLDKEPKSIDYVAEDELPYQTPNPDVFEVLASDFDSVAKRLRSTDYTADAKIGYLQDWARRLTREIESFAAKQKRSTKSPQGQRK